MNPTILAAITSTAGFKAQRDREERNAMKNFPTEAQIDAAQAALKQALAEFNTLKEARDEAINKPKRLALVGKCFKYRNNYSCPDKPSDYWWMWVMVVGESEIGWPITVQTERDKYGRVFVKRDEVGWSDGTPGGGYIPVTRREYDRAVAAILRHATKMSKGKP